MNRASTLVIAMLLAMSDAAFAQGTEGGGIEEIVVTAQKREETVQKSSLAIEVISSAALTKAGINGPVGLQNLVSGLSIAQAGASTQTWIRGVGSFDSNSFGEAAVAYSLDGFYIARPTSVFGNFYDLQRVEVLKGPQGTLYGRNATGGAINLISNKPKLGEWGGNVNVEGGNYSYINGSGALNVPIGQKLALRGAFQVVSRDGYLSDGYDDQKSQAGRLQAYAEPNDKVSVLLSGSYAHLGGNGPGSILAGSPAGNKWTGGADASGVGQPPGLPPGVLMNKRDGFIDDMNYALSADVEVDLGFAKLTVMPGFRQVRNRYRSYVPGFTFDTHEVSREASLETRLSNNTERLKWVVGTFIYRENVEQHFLVDQIINVTTVNQDTLDAKSMAAFGQLTYSVIPTFRLIAGLRYSYESKNQNGIIGLAAGAPSFPPPPLFFTPLDSKQANARLNYKAGIEYDVTPKNMLFATVSTGYKGGGVIGAVAAKVFPPEDLQAIEVGSRNRFYDDKLQVNLEGFYWKYKNKQEGGIRFTPQDGVNFLITPGDATLYGADLDIIWQITKEDRLHLGGEYLHATYDKFDYTTFFVGPASGRTGCGVTPIGPAFGGTLASASCSGRPLPKAPVWSGNISYTHDFPLATGAKITFDATAQLSSSYYLSTDYLPLAKERGFLTADLSLGYTSPDDHFNIAAWVRNVGNTAVYTSSFEEPFIDGVFYHTIKPPQTYGLRAGYNF